ncbi:glycosyltransferase [Calidifontibacter indicus]|uniref:glycosyltransferase n=1 Tax=Calidifontibacter indicus TaxID=419650 RepID=UPI003D7538FE
MQISVVIPCYRSRATIRELVERLVEQLPTLATEFEVILVVDGSPDDTYAIAHQLETEHPGVVHAVLLRRNFGQHNALLAGLSRAAYPITVTMDDDLQHRPDQLATLLAPLDDQFVDLVYGVAVEEEHGFARSFASRTVKAGLAMAGVPNARNVSAFRAFRTELREGFADVSDPFASLDVLVSWTTTSIVAVPVAMDERAEGRSGYTFKALVRHALNMITGYGTLPLRLVTWLGWTTSVLGCVLLVVVIAQYLFGRIAVAGFTTLVSLLAILSGVIMLSLGILGEYIGRLHFRSMNRPMFVVKVDGTAGPRVVRPLPGDEGHTVGRPAEAARAIEQHYARQASDN